MSPLTSFWFLLGLFFLGIVGEVWAVKPLASTHRVVQRASRDGTTRSVTFLSSGYTKQEEDRFDSDVRVCVKALHNRVEGIEAGPWGRYAMLLNIYSVFKPLVVTNSTQSHEIPHLCWATACTLNDLSGGNCAFRSEPFVMRCNFDALFTAATVAPVRDIIVVLVNAPMKVASAGGNFFATFTNEPLFMPFFAIRELSKAIANLAGEYSRGVNAEDLVDVPNCASSIEEAREKWGYLAGRKLIDETPQLGCFFNNYYRPTNASCIMRSSSVGGKMCAVCNEKVNEALLCGATGVSLTSTRCPREGHTVHLAASQDLYLTVGDFGAQPGVVVSWKFKNGTSIHSSGSDAASLLVPVGTWKTWTFPTVVRATIKDSSPYLYSDRCKEKFGTTTDFLLVSGNVSSCIPTTCGSFSVCTSCSGPNCTPDIPSHVEEIKWGTEYGLMLYTTKDNIVLCVFIIFALVVILTLLLYVFFYYRRPHEVLSTSLKDTLLSALLVILSVAVLVFLGFILFWTLRSAEEALLLWGKFYVPFFVLWIFFCIVAVTNIWVVLFRCYKVVIGCGVVEIFLGLCLVGVGAFFLWSHLYRNGASLSSQIAARWLATVKDVPDVVRDIQSHFQCSGFLVACLEVNSSYCPIDSRSNIFPNSCETEFTEGVSSMYLTIGVLSSLAGILMICLALLNFLFVIRFTRLSKRGKYRRAFRTNPNPSIMPFTFKHLDETHRLFNMVADKRNGMTLKGKRASAFLSRVFNSKLDEELKREVELQDALTYNGLMQLYFPYFSASRMDPRQLTPDEMVESEGIVDLQKSQYEKLKNFTGAAGALSPEVLFKLFQDYTRNRFFIKQEEFLSVVKEKAMSCSSEDALLCAGLSDMELEGLRGMWVALNPMIVGDLSDDQIGLFYHWTHDEPLRGSEDLKRWRQSLDVRHRGKIGWSEFCYPFAKRAILLRARRYLGSKKLDVPPELFSRQDVLRLFGHSLCSLVFLPHEEEIPIERLLEHLLRNEKASFGKEE